MVSKKNEKQASVSPKFNVRSLVMQSVLGEVSHPAKQVSFRVAANGEVFTLPGTGGISYNVNVGDPAYGLVGDHIEPAVSTKNMAKEEAYNNAYNIISSIGNSARVVAGDAKGEEGIVIGKHGGIEHVMIQFAKKTTEKLAIGDKIQVKGFGAGLAIEGRKDLRFMNVAPELIANMELVLDAEGKLVVPVAAVVPGYLMGSGTGDVPWRGDFDIMCTDTRKIKELALGSLRFGDIVAIKDISSDYGREYFEDAIMIGVVVHSECLIAGHGPGVTTIVSSRAGSIKPVMAKSSNLLDYLPALGKLVR
jgi:hypothetical protein